MQNIGNTYQTIKNNVASNGNVNSTVSKQNASDFSDLFCSLTGAINSKSLTATSSVQNSMNVKSPVRTIKKNVKSTSSNKTLDKSSNLKTDTLVSNKNSVKQNNHAVKTESAKVEDVRSNLDDEENLSNKSFSRIIVKNSLGMKLTLFSLGASLYSLKINKKGEEIKVPKYRKLDENISVFKKELKKYYNDVLKPKLFEYELLK